jgi:hypothetical protein
MITEEYVNKLLIEILQENDKIPLTARGYEFLVDELKKKLPVLEYEILVQPIEELTLQERKDRQIPKITVKIK